MWWLASRLRLQLIASVDSRREPNHMTRWICLGACVALNLVGCTNTPDEGGYRAPLCSSDGTCAGAARCEAGVCHDACAADADCPSGAICHDGLCWAAAGAACATDAECPAGDYCVAGTCVSPPSPIACASDADCPAGSACAGGSCVASSEICGNGIDDDLDGLVDEGCAGLPCAADVDCAAGEVCISGLCTVGGTDADGDGYATGSDCDDADATIHPGAVEACNGTDDDCDGSVDEGCAPPIACASDADCAAGQVCVSGGCTVSGTAAAHDG